MILRPNNLKEIQDALAAANSLGEQMEGFELSALTRVLAHSPEDMTVSVESGITLADLQQQLSSRGQWLPIDPPRPTQLTVEELLSQNLSGPRRFGSGTIRDHLIGLKVALAEGQIIKAGGKVVKNVAGYDLCKLFIGSQRTLGLIVEATFKLKPIPETEIFVETHGGSLQYADSVVSRVLDSELTPTVLDMHNLGDSTTDKTKKHKVVIGFSGLREDVEFQERIAHEFGAAIESSLDYETDFWNLVRDKAPNRHSVLPSDLTRTLQGLGDVRYVARAGNGVIWHCGAPASKRDDLPTELFNRVKKVYDPNGVFPNLSA